MPKYTVTSPTGEKYTINAPDGATEDQVLEYAKTQFAQMPKKQAEAQPGTVDAFTTGLKRGLRDVIDKPAELLQRGVYALGAGRFLEGLGDKPVADQNKEALAAYDRTYGNSTPASIARVGGQIAASTPVVGAAGMGLSAAGRLGGVPALEALGSSIASFGTSGTLPQRVAGGAISSGAAAGMVDPSNIPVAAALGGAFPLALAGAGRVGDAVSRHAKLWTEGGREQAAGSVLRSAVNNPDDVIANLRAAKQVIPGSAPTTAMAGGDEGLAATLNVIADKTPEVGAAARRAADARNVARNTFMQNLAGDEAGIAAAQAGRDAITGPMREAVLSGAKPIPASTLLDPLEALAKDPRMAGKNAQDAIATVKASFNRIAEDGQINPTALYEIRKDIGDLMAGKFSGDLQNVRLAPSTLIAIRNRIDDAIDAASAKPGLWKDYLKEYARASKEIGQKETLQEILMKSGAGTVDSAGNPILYPSKLNNLMRTKGSELAKELKPEQFDALRRLQADLNAEQLAMNASRSATGNSVTSKMLSTGNELDSILGFVPGGGAIARTAQFLNQGNKQRVMGLLGDAYSNPELAAYLLQQGAVAQRQPGLLGTSLGYAAPRAIPMTPGLLGQRE